MMGSAVRRAMLLSLLFVAPPLLAQQISLQSLVKPSTVIEKNGRPVMFAIHGFIEFQSLAEALTYADSQARRWKGTSVDSPALAKQLVREAVESRVMSMEDERPLEAIVTHTTEELRAALEQLKDPVPAGYADAFLAVQ